MLSDETFDAWLIDLRGLANSCGYGASLDSVLRDQIVLGINNPLVREKLLYEKELLLDKACEIARACESSKAQLTQINTSSAAHNAHALQSRHVDRKPARKTEPQPVVGHRSSQSHFAADNQKYTRCSNCGRRHRKNQCRVTNSGALVVASSGMCPVAATVHKLIARCRRKNSLTLLLEFTP